MNLEPIVQSEGSQKESEVVQSCLTLCDPMDCSLPGSSIHGIFQAKNTGVGCHFLLQEIFPTQWLNLGLLHCRQTLYCLSHQGSNTSERERQILYINACVWDLGRWYWGTYLQGSSGDASVENRFVDTVWEEEGGTNWKNSMERYITICKIESGNLLGNRELNSVLCDNLDLWDGKEVGGRFKKEGTYVYQWLIHVDIWQKPAQYYTANIINTIFLNVPFIVFQFL